jgi:iron complex transport system ATP-binding protein
MIKIENLDFTYHGNKKNTLSNINIQVDDGEFFGIIGPNGAGKTTLFKLILGFLKPQNGRILVNDEDIKKLKRKEISRMMSAVMQDFSPTYDFTVEEIVHLGRTPYLGLFSNESNDDYQMVRKSILETELEGYEEKLFNRLSGGERQRVLIAKCFAQDTPVILLDEFVAHLDLGHVQQLINRVYIKNKRDKVTVIGIFHDINTAALYCDRLAVLVDGKIHKIGTPNEIVDLDLLNDVYKANSYIVNHKDDNKPQVILRK